VRVELYLSDLLYIFESIDRVVADFPISMKLMLAGNYVKYVDDFRSAIVGWKSNWLTLTCMLKLFKYGSLY
jgi:hypothetical protein